MRRLALRAGLGLVALTALLVLLVPRLVPAYPAAADAGLAELGGSAPARVGELRAGGRVLDVAPAATEADTVLVLLPGARVAPEAYAWLGAALAPEGVRLLVPTLPLGLAVLAPGRPGRVLATLDAAGDLPGRVVVGGHSLGGVLAARWAAAHPEAVDGLLLLGAYPAGDLATSRLPTLVVAAERDGLVTLDEARAGLERLPPDARLVVVPGAVHAHFGRYGPQRGDGTAAAPRPRAEAAIAAAVAAFLAGLEPGAR